jgi:hypothetical protein|tara:strand:+ start:349 stop:759 length:411 start_codon:yes stop_codon:yes gene_type:complete
MAVQQILGKRITKYDMNDPNYKPLKPKIVEEVNGNLVENQTEDNIYGENTYQAPTESNGNLKLEQMMSKMMGKIDKFGNRIDRKDSQTGTEAIEVDIQREIAISKVDMSAVKSEVIKGKVKTKKDKLKALRRRNRK